MGGYNKQVDKIGGWSLAILAITRSLAVMHGDSTLGSPTIDLLLYIVTYACLLCLLPCVFLRMKSVITSSLLLLLCISLYFLVSFLHSYKGDAGLNIVMFVIMICFCFSNNEVRLYAFRIFKVFLVISSFLGIIAYFSYMFSLGIPYRIVPFYDQISMSYVDYGFAYLTTSFISSRLCGLFNEPGYLGTMAALCLIADNLNFRKMENVILVVAGILSLSLAFFILIFFALLVKGLRDRKTAIFVVLAIIAIAVSLPALVKMNEGVEHLVERFTFEDGVWLGDNRADDVVDTAYEQMFKQNSNLLFGYGTGYTANIEKVGTSSYKGIILDYGLGGVVIIWGLLFIAAAVFIKPLKFRKNAYILLICFFLSIYQRPYVITVNYLLVLFGGILYLEDCLKQHNQVGTNKEKKYERGRHNPALQY